MANITQRLYASSGRAGYSDLPWLYGQLALRRQRAAAGMQGQDFMGEPKLPQLQAMAGGTTGGSVGAPLGGGARFGPIGAPGKTGAPGNFLNNVLGGGGYGRSEGGGYGGGPGGIAEREADMARRGLTDDPMGMLDAAQNALSLMGSGIVQTGLASMGELGLGLPQGTLGGITNVRGYYAMDPDLIDAIRRGLPYATARQIMEGRHAGQPDLTGGGLVPGAHFLSAGPVRGGPGGGYGSNALAGRIDRGGYYSSRGYGGPPSRGGGGNAGGGYGGGNAPQGGYGGNAAGVRGY